MNNNFSIEDQLRFFVTGVVAVIFTFVANPDWISKFVETEGLDLQAAIVGMSLFSFVLGTALFFVYRAIIYSNVIRPLVFRLMGSQCFHFRLASLMSSPTNTDSALFEEFLKKKIEIQKMHFDSSAVHLQFQISFLALFFLLSLVVPIVWTGTCPEGMKTWFFVATFLFFGIAGLISDTRIERFVFFASFEHFPVWKLCREIKLAGFVLRGKAVD